MLIKEKEDKKSFNRSKLLNYNFNVLNLIFTKKQIDTNDISGSISYIKSICSRKKLDYFNTFDIKNKICKSLKFILQSNKRTDIGFDLDLYIKIIKNINSQETDFISIDNEFKLNEDEIEVNKFSKLVNKCGCNHLFINLNSFFIDSDNYIYFFSISKVVNTNKFEKLINKLEEDLNFINNYVGAFNEHSYFKFENLLYYLNDGKIIKKYDGIRFNNKIYCVRF